VVRERRGRPVFTPVTANPRPAVIAAIAVRRPGQAADPASRRAAPRCAAAGC